MPFYKVTICYRGLPRNELKTKTGQPLLEREEKEYIGGLFVAEYQLSPGGFLGEEERSKNDRELNTGIGAGQPKPLRQPRSGSQKHR